MTQLVCTSHLFTPEPLGQHVGGARRYLCTPCTWWYTPCIIAPSHSCKWHLRVVTDPCLVLATPPHPHCRQYWWHRQDLTTRHHRSSAITTALPPLQPCPRHCRGHVQFMQSPNPLNQGCQNYSGPQARSGPLGFFQGQISGTINSCVGSGASSVGQGLGSCVAWVAAYIHGQAESGGDQAGAQVWGQSAVWVGDWASEG